MSGNMEKINTIYIFSKGRPQCITANTLNRIDYTGEWYIVIQEDEIYKDEYIENWGEEKVIPYDYYKYLSETELLDSFGDNFWWGASPARNATIYLADSRNEKRFWFADDDIERFLYNGKTVIDGKFLENMLLKIATMSDKANIEKIALKLDTTFPVSIRNLDYKAGVFFNCKTNTDLLYHGRVTDDVITSYLTYHSSYSNIEIEIATMKCKGARVYDYEDRDNNEDRSGGNKELYDKMNKLLTASYILLVCPLVKIRIYDNNVDKMKHTNEFRNIRPMIINNKYKK